jgi:apolipoprotein N-acyltransferase
VLLIPFITPVGVAHDGAAEAESGQPLPSVLRLVLRFGHFLTGLYWVGNAFLVDAKTFGWLLPVAVIALPAGLALYTAFGFLLARLIWTRGATRILALACAMTVAEWLRGHLFSGFPWNTFGYLLASPRWLA